MSEIFKWVLSHCWVEIVLPSGEHERRLARKEREYRRSHSVKKSKSAHYIVPRCLPHALSQLYFGNQSTVPSGNDLPKQGAGIDITNSKLGKDAVAEFTSLHNEGFRVTSGAVGVYGNGAIT
jgi:hypothetical protein